MSNQPTVEIIAAGTATVVEVSVPGPQGPPGPSGAAGSTYIHNQPSAAATWTIAHNLGFKPSVELLNTGSQEIEADVVHQSTNVCLVYFTTPTAGFARLN